MCQEDQAARNDKRNQQRRQMKTVARIYWLFGTCALALVFVKAIWAGYLTWIGIVVGFAYISPGILTPLFGLTGKKAWEKRLGRVYACLVVATLAVLGTVLFWPEDPGSWRPFSFDAELAALEAERAVPDEENTAWRYEVALATVDINDRPDSAFEGVFLRDDLSEQPWREEDYLQASGWLDSHEEIIAELQQIGQMTQCRWPVYANSECEWTVPYRELHYGRDLLILAGNRHLGEGRLDEAMQTSFCLFRYADHLRQQTYRLDFEIAFKPERAALQMIRHILMHDQLIPEDTDFIAQHLPDAANTWNRDIARLLRFDEYRFAQFVAPVYEISNEGRIRFAASFHPFPEERHNRKSSARVGRLWRLYRYTNTPRDADGIWAMAKQESARVARVLEPGPMLRIPRDELYPRESVLDYLAEGLTNKIPRMARSRCYQVFMYTCFGEYYSKNLTQRRGTWLVLGLRKYRDEHGSWPESLDQISERVPAEAFDDPTSGDRFVYVLDDDSFKLYSKGINRIDEGGRMGYIKNLDRNEDDITIWPPRRPTPPNKRSMELRKQQLREIYGEDWIIRTQKDANDV